LEKKKLLYSLIFFSVLAVLKASANEGHALSPEIVTEAFQQVEELRKQANQLIKQNLLRSSDQRHSQRGCSSQPLTEKTRMTNGCTQNPLNASEKPAQILVFVSFSMPELSLKSLFQEARLHHAVLIMRGLEQDSFRKTVLKLQGLGITVDMNPELFEKHHIESVPTFILLKNGTYRLKGNVSLSFAAQKLKDHWEDQSALKKHRGAL